jgi:hypothetical protein
MGDAFACRQVENGPEGQLGRLGCVAKFLGRLRRKIPGKKFIGEEDTW